MGNAKEIRTKIQSIKQTQKITRAMEMVSASKVRKAQDRMLKTRPYAEQILAVIAHLGEANPEYKPAFLDVRPVKRAAYIIVSTDRGLCGALNNGLFKKVMQEAKRYHEQNVEVDFCTLGQKSTSFFHRVQGKVIAQATHLGDNPGVKDIIGAVKVMFDLYQSEKIDELNIAYNTFENTMVQRPTIKKLLPIEPGEHQMAKHHWDYIYEPDAKMLIDFLLRRYVESQAYQAIVENIASEHASRMVAMKSATENAGDLIERLQLIYNKARQASITQELAEIVAGAAAV
ncbi:MAG: F0F1 ATP synthase subunit gamma [Legionellales bacterium]|nr:F0F1 ATP synthase subunit gamma [Legionellales bacterium]